MTGAPSDLPSVRELLSHAVEAVGGTEREGQLRMADAVDRAIRTGEHLAVQAGTGTGKSLAYLVPAIRHAVASETTVVVSTATIALQRQLVDRDPAGELGGCYDRGGRGHRHRFVAAVFPAEVDRSRQW